MADTGTYGHTLVPAASWGAAGLEHVEQLAAEQLGEIAPGREREPGERVMVVYRAGIMLPGSVGDPVDRPEPELVLVLVEIGPLGDALGWWPGSMLRTLVHEQCVPAELVAEIAYGWGWDK